MNITKQLEKDIKEITCLLDRMIEREEQYTKTYNILIKKLERSEKRNYKN